jgi:hypothetical protein
MQQPVEQHAWLDFASLALVDHVLPCADLRNAGVVKHEPLAQVRVEHKGHVVLAVVRDRAGELEGGVADLCGDGGDRAAAAAAAAVAAAAAAAAAGEKAHIFVGGR